MEKNRKGKRNYRGKPQRDDSRRKDAPEQEKPENSKKREDRLSPLNDINWYNRNPALLSAVSKIPFPYKPGMNVPLAEGAGTTTPVNTRIPGIMKLVWAPYIGTTSADTPTTDPVNIAAREIFNRVRSSFSGSLDADAPDFMIYFMALDSIFSYIGYLKRMFRIIGSYTPDNYAIPDSLLGAFVSTASVNELRQNKMKFFQYINELVHMTDKFVCPALFDVFNRHYWLCDNVYADAPSLNSQMYVFTPNRLMQFRMINIGTSTDTVMAGGLSWAPIPTSKATNDADIVDTLYNYGTQLINALSAWDDAFIISGYLRRAFEGAPAFRVDEIGYTEPFAPVYVPEVLAQIENAFTALPWQVAITLNNVTQDPANNTLKVNYTVTPVASNQTTLHPFINIRSDAPTEEEVVEATRLQTYFDAKTQQIIAGTELLEEISINGGSGQYYTVIPSLMNYDLTKVTGDSLSQACVLKALLSSFDWHPFCFHAVYNTVNGETWLSNVSVFGDIHNFTTMTLEMARQLNRVCLFSEFNAFGID